MTPTNRVSLMAALSSALLLAIVTPGKGDVITGAGFTPEASGAAVEAGQILPLVADLFNGGSTDATITVTLKAVTVRDIGGYMQQLPNPIFSQDLVIAARTLPAGLGVHFSQGLGPLTTLGLPTGVTALTELDTTVLYKGETTPQVVQVVQFYLTILPVGGLASLITIPVRWCAVEGSWQAEGKKAGEFVDGANLLSLMRSQDFGVWVPFALIEFVSAYAPKGIPVIADPDPALQTPSSDPLTGQLGDLVIPEVAFDPGRFDLRDARFACEDAWSKSYPDQKGTIAVNYRITRGCSGASSCAGPNGVDYGTLGASFAPNPDLWITGSRANDFCWHPRHLSKTDVAPCQVVFVEDQAMYSDTTDFSGLGPAAFALYNAGVTVAHELGHSLMLGHGKGVDPDNDGLLPPAPGARRFDCLCDPQGPTGGNANPYDQAGIVGGDTIVTEFSSAYNMTPLQVEQVREVALLIPGAVASGVPADPSGALMAAQPASNPPPVDVQIVAAEISEDPISQTTALLLRVVGPIPVSATNEYVFFVDVDNNPTTGCEPASLGFPTAFEGADLVARVSLSPAGGTQTITPSVWTCQRGVLVETNDPGIRGASFTQTGWTALQQGFGYVSIAMPDAVAGILGQQVRVQALARQVGPGGQLDRLPAGPASGGLISLSPPKFAQCTVNPSTVRAPGTTLVTATGLLSNQTAEVYLGNNLLATGSIDSNGTAQVNVAIPADTAQRAWPVSVKVQGAAVSADSVLFVLGGTASPATTATLSPGPNAAGWNNSNVVVTLTAVPVPGGPVVDHITYRAAGAQTIAYSVVPGSTVSVLITAEGETTIGFFATDSAGSAEPLEQVTVKLDKTPPLISGLATPLPNAAGWNNTDVTVNFSCSDSLSGTLFCQGSVTVTTEGANQTVAGRALDNAFNGTTLVVSGINIDKTPPSITCPTNVVVDFSDGSGAIASYPPPLATDNFPGVTSNCAPPSGSLFPIGTNVITCIAIDVAGNTNSCTFTVAVLGPRGIKVDILSSLLALVETVSDKPVSDHLKAAITALTASLDPSLWIDETHLQQKGADQVFQDEKGAVNALRLMLGNTSGGVPGSTVQGFIDRIVKADRLLVTVAIQDGINAGAGAKGIALADQELIAGDTAIGGGEYEDGIEHYRNAWRHAMLAVKGVTQ
jgi:hypothetical protein